MSRPGTPWHQERGQLFKKFYFKNLVFFNWYSKKRWVKVQKKSQLNNSRGLEITAAEAMYRQQTKTIQYMQSCSVSLLILSVFPSYKTHQSMPWDQKKKSLTNGYEKPTAYKRRHRAFPPPPPSSLLALFQVRLFRRQFTSKSSWSPLPPSSLGDMEFWMLKDSSSFRQDLRVSWILWGALGSS